MTRSFKLGVQALEAREVPTVVTLEAGILRITGTESAESIVVRQSATHLTVDGETGSWAMNDVSEVWIDAASGNDTVDLQRSGMIVTERAVILGGSGNDRLYAGNGNDHLDGGSGNDTLFGFGGNDRLAGDTGDDVMFGGSENDNLAGGGGKDILIGEGGTDRLDGGREFDTYLDPTAGENVHDDWGPWANNIVGSGYTHHHMLGAAVSSEFGWYDANTADSGLRRDARAADRDASISRTEMIALLRSAGDGGSVTADEFADLAEITPNESIGMSDAVRNLSKKVAHGDRANQWFTGGVKQEPLGNLTAGSFDDKLEKLVGKWFLGTDRPLAKNYDRSETFGYKAVVGELFVDGVDVTDINQGEVGDCYFMAGLGAVAVQDEGRIENMFTDNGDGTFTVRFFRDGVAEFVTVDRSLPVRVGGKAGPDTLVFANNGQAAYSTTELLMRVGTPAQPPRTLELWVALAEKAYAQVNESGWLGIERDGTNSYHGVGDQISPNFWDGEISNGDGLNGGFGDAAMRHIAGVSTTVNTFWFTTFAELRQVFDSGKAITFATKQDLSEVVPVIGGHEYIVTGYNAVKQTITLRNPWGQDSQVKRGEVVIATRPVEVELTLSQLKDLFDSWSTAAV